MIRLLLHPFFLLCCSLFIANQVAERTGNGFPLLSAYLDDLLCLPIVLTITLFLMQRYALGQPDYRLPDGYLLLAFLIFSLVFEGLLPLLSPVCVRDAWDVVAYAAGGILFRQLINLPRKARSALLAPDRLKEAAGGHQTRKKQESLPTYTS
jgi:hypothetical protein